MLTREAFNALLKTLEEPPPGTVFIFATTELHKVPATILSRCQVFEFKKVSPRDIVGRLKQIAGEKSLTISAGGLALIAEASEGSLRDAVSLLDQAVAFCGETIGDTELKELLGTVNKDLLFEFSTAVLEEKPERIFSLTATVLETGYDLRLFMKEIIQHFRNILVVKSVPAPGDLIVLASPEELARLKAEAGKAGEEDLIRCLQALQAAEPGLKFSPHPQIHFETTLVKICHYRKIAALKDLILEIEEPQKGGGAVSESRPTKPAWTPAAPRKAEPPAGLGEGFRTRNANPPAGSAEARPGAKAPSAPEGPRPGRGENPASKSEEKAALEEPGVKSFLDKFKARIISVDELKAKADSEEE
jgi:DNA polymerase-3 subunit gamma/tau